MDAWEGNDQPQSPNGEDAEVHSDGEVEDNDLEVQDPETDEDEESDQEENEVVQVRINPRIINLNDVQLKAQLDSMSIRLANCRQQNSILSELLNYNLDLIHRQSDQIARAEKTLRDLQIENQHLNNLFEMHE